MDPISIFAIIGGLALFIGLIGDGKVMTIEISKVPKAVRIICVIIGISMLSFSIYSYMKQRKTAEKNKQVKSMNLYPGKTGKK